MPKLSDLKKLRNKNVEIKKKLSELENERSSEENQELIQLFHRYNEIKDWTQMVIGKIANKEQTTVKELFKEYDLNIDD